MTMMFQISGFSNAPEFLIQLEKFGLIDAILPFILIFAVIFTVLQKTNAIGEKKQVHGLVALVISLLVILPHVMGTYPPGQDVVKIINTAIPNISLVIVIIVSALILAGIFMPTPSTGIPGKQFFMIASIGAIVYIFGLSAGWWETVNALNFLANPDIQVLLVIIAVFGLIIMLITSDNPAENMGNMWNRLIGRGGT